MNRLFNLLFQATMLAAFLWSGSSTLLAQSFVDEIRQSRWDTYYQAQGQNVHAIVTFDDEDGTYDLVDDNGNTTETGILSGLKYFEQNRNGVSKVLITGKWSFVGQTGFVQFDVSENTSDTLKGAWGRDGGGDGGKWNGSRLENDSGPGPGSDPSDVTYEDWKFNEAKGYYYRTCNMPAGAHQYVIFYKHDPQWVYWFNPAKKIYWCRCPTKNNSEWGNEVENGANLYAMAVIKKPNLQECRFTVCNELSDFKPGITQDADGSQVTLPPPPTDLPEDLP